MPTDDIWDARRQKLEKELARAALELSAHTGASAFMLPLDSTTPALYVAVGSTHSLRYMADTKAGVKS